MLSGFLHPLLGMDHLLAMVAVGLISAQMGGRAVWTVPAVFVVLMAIGGVLGIAAFNLPLLEIGISGSVIILGVAIATQGKLPTAAIMALVGLFGFLHGNAHGLELPSATDTLALTVAYVAGFLIATVGLHLVGALLGLIAERRGDVGTKLLRASGGLIAVLGVMLVSQL